jgi:O-antigen ligase
LRLPQVLLVLGLLSGIIVGRNAGGSTKSLVLAENVTAYLVVLPLTVANMRLHRRMIKLVLGGLLVVALAKGLLGLAEIASGRGLSIEGTAALTYYEPTANWVVMVALLGLFAAVLARVRPPLWMLLGSPLLIGSLVLSYRRSFWIAAVLGLLLVLLLALSPLGRRLLVPSALIVAAAIWLLGSVTFQSQSPIVRRAVSLSPTSVTKNVEDRYRLDERANVLAELKKHPITGLGELVPWSASARPLPVEHESGREYVHFTALYLWLKLGIFGLAAYVTLLLATGRLAWRVWRESHDAIVRCFGLASLCGTVGLLAAETTASFTGVDLRFTVVFAAQIGLLALIAGPPFSPAEADGILPAGRSVGPAPVG